jgi:hypothetical protein
MDKKKAYSLYKMFEQFRNDCLGIMGAKGFESYHGLTRQYQKLYVSLKKLIGEEEVDSIPYVNFLNTPPMTRLTPQEKIAKIYEIFTASGIATSYLISLQSSFEKELETKKKYLDMREKEIESKEAFITKTTRNVKELLELSRSRAVEETKKSHRGIEKYSRKK